MSEPLEARRLLTILTDVDGDGDLDAVRAHAWYENQDGLGDFSESVFASDDDVDFQVVDLDGDSDPDVITSTGAWYENVDGRITTARRWDRISKRYDSIRLIDNDFDGDLDIIASFRNDHAALFVNRGRGGVFSLQSSVDGPFIVVGDFDGDGLLDKVMRDGDFWLHRNQGNGTFEIELVRERLLGVTEILGVADVDGNGYEDIFISEDIASPSFTWMKNEGGYFSREVPLGVGDGLLFLSDLDDDGDLDGVGHYAGWDLTWGYTAGNGGLRGGVYVKNDVAFGPVPRLGYITDIGDINGDGRLDFVYDSGAPIWLDGNTLDFRDNSTRTPVGDVTNDGLFDSSDLVAVFSAGEYEDNVPMNSTWAEGDWDRDGDFNSSDLVFAFQSGSYRITPAIPGNEIAAAVDSIFARNHDEVKKSGAIRA